MNSGGVTRRENIYSGGSIFINLFLRSKKMTINYALFENHLTSDPDDYAAQVKITGSAGLEVVAQRMIDQGSTVTKPDILAVLEDAIKALQEDEISTIPEVLHLVQFIQGSKRGICR